MVDRPRIFDDLAGIAGTAFSAFSGAREELHALIRSRIDEVLYSLDLVRREEFDAVQEMASRARQSHIETADRLTALENRLSDLEQLLTEPESTPKP
ncbi:accessory factor UbiK family protein [Aristophania vespae]|uniref:Accessory factor UbiK family protein n=1 Tax=Aristophania vespae TaxID=2697033 RepID=A0A6P1NKY3_9PROT|nr:accessory factor UbiK family protein [Aristophania vespae]QHI94945.1 accessory factor UbiK family protein [Aristophania vespae]QHI96292.1 accessory factor UbiK family protein [Aristophania vespae]UMM64107.1 Ubiquinone biosynthesis accessory factor UbiK [Aristophania vespae]